MFFIRIIRRKMNTYITLFDFCYGKIFRKDEKIEINRYKSNRSLIVLILNLALYNKLPTYYIPNVTVECAFIIE